MKYNNNQFSCLGALTVLFAAVSLTQAAVVQKTESFASEASARANNWRSMGSKSYGNNIGWSATSFAGGTAGEAYAVSSGANSVDNLWFGDYFGPDNLLYYTNEVHMTGKMALKFPVQNGNSFGPGYFYWNGTGSIETRVGGIRFEGAEGGGGEGIGGSGGAQRFGLILPFGGIYTLVTNYPTMSNPMNVLNSIEGNVKMPNMATNVVYDVHYYPPGSTWNGNVYPNGLVHFRLWGKHWNGGVPDFLDYFEIAVSLNSDPSGTAPVNGFWAASANAIKPSGERRQENLQWAHDDVSYTAVTGTTTPHCIVLIDAFALPEFEDETLLNIGFNGRLGQPDRTLTIVIPPEYNATTPYALTVTSADPSINQPQGAVAGAKTVIFAAGGDTTANVPVEFLTVGTNSFTVASTNGACFADGSNVVLVTSQPATPVATAPASEFQAFASSLSASNAGWAELGSRINNQDFGFSATANAGGSAGEAGGTTHSESLRASYADLSSGTPLTLNDYISASGRLAITGWDPVDFPLDAESGTLARYYIGHARKSLVGTTSNNGNLGINLRFINGMNIIPFVVGNSSGESGIYSRSTNELVVVPPANLTWSYAYDPNGGAWGNGRLTVLYSNDNSGWTQTRFADVRYSRRIQASEYDSFGMTTRRFGGEDSWSTNFIDNVTYTVPAAVKIVKIETLPGPLVKITFDSNGTNHRVDKRDAVATGSWSTQSGVTFGGSPGALTATFAQPVNTAQFYRVVVVP